MSSVKSRSTRMLVDSDTSAIMSAGNIFVCTNFLAESTPRSICSGSIPEKSKNSSINRRSRASIDGWLVFFSRLLVPAAPLLESLRDRRVLAFLVVWFGVNLLFGLGSIGMPGVEQAIAWIAEGKSRNWKYERR